MIVLTQRLLYGILPRGFGDRFASMARECGGGGATLCLGRGTVVNPLLKALGISGGKKDIVVVNASEEVVEAISRRVREEGFAKGVCASVGGDGMRSDYVLITVIVNSGYSDDVVDVARKAGAIGGTVVDARGTALAEDQSLFLGMRIVPEKEVVMMICPRQGHERITEAIAGMECLREMGMGVMFTQPVSSFVQFGK